MFPEMWHILTIAKWQAYRLEQIDLLIFNTVLFHSLIAFIS